MFKQKCTICGLKFETPYESKRVCSFECKQIKKQDCARIWRRRHVNSNPKENPPCIVCGWKLTIDTHHEKMKSVPLCPNHHSLITRNVVLDVQQIIQKKL